MAGRNANGEGTIYRRKDGRYEGAVYVLTTDGTRRRIRKYGKTRAEVHEKLIAAKARDQQGIPIPTKAPKVKDYLEYWLENVVKRDLRPSTHESYEKMCARFLKPHLGNYALTALTVPIVQTFLNQRLNNGQPIRQVEIMRTILSSALTSAQREELVSRNVARLVRLPEYKPEPVYPWSVAEAKEFLGAVRGHSLYPTYLILVLYGFRRGEVLGLRWQDIDFAREELHVRQQVMRVGGKIHIGPVKTDAGRRDLPLLDIVKDALLEHRERQAQMYRASGEAWIGGKPGLGLIFTSSVGTAIDPQNFYHRFLRACAKYGIRRIKVHHVRHTTATLLKDLGVPDRDIQLILGHASITTTQQLYEHDSLSSRREHLTKLKTQLFLRVDDVHLRCRQISRQTLSIVEEITSAICGAPGRIRTCDLEIRRSAGDTISERLTGVRKIADDRIRCWLVGAVAVSVAVKIDTDSTALV